MKTLTKACVSWFNRLRNRLKGKKMLELANKFELQVIDLEQEVKEFVTPFEYKKAMLANFTEVDVRTGVQDRMPCITYGFKAVTKDPKTDKGVHQQLGTVINALQASHSIAAVLGPLAGAIRLAGENEWIIFTFLARRGLPQQAEALHAFLKAESVYFCLSDGTDPRVTTRSL